MKANEQLDRLIADQASEWMVKLDRRNDETDPAFAEWLLDSKRNTKIFLMTVALDRELEHFDPERKHAIPLFPKGGAEVVPLREPAEAQAARSSELAPARAPRRSRTPLHWWSLAAVFVAALGVLMTLNVLPGFSNGWKEYATAVGEQRVLELEDGSTVRLNTNSRLAVRLSEHTRDIRLIDGEAIFKVYHDTSRPFRVYTTGAFIQAVGTEFNVYRRAEKTTVAVLEGRVQISKGSGTVFETTPPAPKAEAFLAAGEQAEIDKRGRVAGQHRTDLARVSAWSQHRLVFKQESLAEIVTQFNRYNSSPRFKVVGASISERRYSGVFNVDDPQSLRALLAGEPDLIVEDQGEEIVIRLRSQVFSVGVNP